MLPRITILQVGDIHLPSSRSVPVAVDAKDRRFPPFVQELLAVQPVKIVFEEIYHKVEMNKIAALLIMGDLTDFGDMKGYGACAKWGLAASKLVC
jgi:hypothetical protein